MSEVVNVVVAFVAIVFIFRWITSGDDTVRTNAQSLGFSPKNVTPEMVNTVTSMFPDIPADNIRYDLLRTGSTQATTNKILESGFLSAPPAAYFNIYPRSETAAVPPSARTSAAKPKPKETLISRFSLEERINHSGDISAEDAGGKAIWEDTPEKREASLKERKAQMILAARQRMLAQQDKVKTP